MTGRFQPAPPEAATSNGRVPPHDLDAENAILSAVLCEERVDRVAAMLRPEMFYSPANRRIWEACAALSEAGTPCDAVTVGEWLKTRERLAEVGGLPYLARVCDSSPSLANLEAHAEIIVKKHQIRLTIGMLQKRAAEGYTHPGEPSELVEATVGDLFTIADGTARTEAIHVKPIIKQAFAEIQAASDRGEAITGLATGFAGLDEITSGMHEGELIIVAARPGMGKTAFANNVGVNVASVEVDGAFPNVVASFSLEMDKKQLVVRMVCTEASVNLSKVRKGVVSSDDWTRLTQASSFLSGLPLYVDDDPSLTIVALRMHCRRLEAAAKAEGKRLALVMVDYLQLMDAPGIESRQEQVSSIARGLKKIAREFGVPVVALAQLNRGVDKQKDKRPCMSDLRESGAIEQDADVIIFIYRDEYYDSKSPFKGIAELILAKQRNGPTGKIPVRFTGSCTRFDNLEPNEIPPSWHDDNLPNDRPKKPRVLRIRIHNCLQVLQRPGQRLAQDKRDRFSLRTCLGRACRGEVRPQLLVHANTSPRACHDAACLCRRSGRGERGEGEGGAVKPLTTQPRTKWSEYMDPLTDREVEILEDWCGGIVTWNELSDMLRQGLIAEAENGPGVLSLAVTDKARTRLEFTRRARRAT